MIDIVIVSNVENNESAASEQRIVLEERIVLLAGASETIAANP